jgi:ubiquinone biosynthesis protein
MVRGMDILFIIAGYFFINWMSNRKFTTKFLVPEKYKYNGVAISTHERIKITIEKLGPTFIKFAQILADRPDIISDKLRFELKKLQSSVKPFDDNLAKQIIEKELGGPVTNFFERIEFKCIGSASIGQVYKAKLISGEDVIVKIQRPDIKTNIELDLQLLQILAKKISREYPEFIAIDLSGFVEEFGETLMYELNYFNEASNAMRFAEMFYNVSHCKIPKVYTDLSTHKILVMEYVTGIIPGNPHKLRNSGLDPKQIAINGTNIFLKMIFEHGFFHADPHAGNLFIQEDNKIAIIDFGMAGTLKPLHMQFLAEFTLGIAMKNAQTISNSLLKLSGSQFFKEKDDLEFRIQEMINRYGSLSYKKIKFSQVLNECIKIIVKFGIKVPSSIYLLIKALATIEKLGNNLDRELSLAAQIKPFAINLIQKQFSIENLTGEVFDAVKTYISFIRSFPSELSEIMYNIKKGRLVHDIQLDNDQIFVKSIKHLGRMLGLALITGFMLIGSVTMIALNKDIWIVELMFLVSSFFSVWLLVRLFFKMSL